MDAALPSSSTVMPRGRSYLIVNNVQKLKNIKTMLASAAAFGVAQVFIVGQKKFDLSAHAAYIAQIGLSVSRMASLSECQQYCHAHNIRILGVEILHNAASILDEPFDGDTAFIMGNEGAGMNAAQIAICDAFVFIPQYGGGTASLNVTVAASLILHRFALWAQAPIVAQVPMPSLHPHVRESVAAAALTSE